MYKIGLAVSTIFHYEHLKYVYAECEDAVFIIFGTSSIKTRSIADHLAKENVHYCTMFDVLNNDARVDILISVYWQPAFVTLGDRVMHVRIMYGYAKDDWNYGEWNRHYDLIFTYGKYASERLARYATCIESGHPRMVPDAIEQAFALRRKKACGRPTILYCPTYGVHSSLREFDGIVWQLTDVYDIVIKLHHLNDLENCPNLIEGSQSGNIVIHDERTDLIVLLPECDLVISDHSGAIFDAMLFEKKIVLIDPQTMEDSIASGLKSPNASLDIKVRNAIPHGKISDMADLIPKTLHASIPYRQWMKELFHAERNPAQLICKETRLKHDAFGPVNKLAGILNALFRLVKSDSRKLVVCGAGEFGQAVCAWLKSRKIDVAFMIDAVKHKEDQPFDIPVLSPDIMRQLSPDEAKCIIATVAGGQAYENGLTELGFVKNVDYVCAYD